MPVENVYFILFGLTIRPSVLTERVLSVISNCVVRTRFQLRPHVMIIECYKAIPV